MPTAEPSELKKFSTREIATLAKGLINKLGLAVTGAFHVEVRDLAANDKTVIVVNSPSVQNWIEALKRISPDAKISYQNAGIHVVPGIPNLPGTTELQVPEYMGRVVEEAQKQLQSSAKKENRRLDIRSTLHVQRVDQVNEAVKKALGATR